jgi:hypothetical protein
MDGMALQQSQSSETLGQAIIPAINKLQDIFSQVRLGKLEIKGEAQPWPTGPSSQVQNGWL